MHLLQVFVLIRAFRRQRIACEFCLKTQHSKAQGRPLLSHPNCCLACIFQEHDSFGVLPIPLHFRTSMVFIVWSVVLAVMVLVLVVCPGGGGGPHHGRP